MRYNNAGFTKSHNQLKHILKSIGFFDKLGYSLNFIK